jgi:DNA (cytosine-5)-methyltransferase 1
MHNEILTHLDLFSGIGGFALAADRAFGNVEHTFCEIDPFCQEVLKKHWPEAKVYGDIRSLTKKQFIADARGKELRGVHQLPRAQGSEARHVHLLTGGFPCQPFSQAGRRKGTADDRYLWPEMLRVIREFKPTWVIGENVGGLVTWNDGMVLEQVHADLEGEGYEVQAFIIPACAVNAPHRRDRVWIVANRNHIGCEGQELLQQRGFGDRRGAKHTLHTDHTRLERGAVGEKYKTYEQKRSFQEATPNTNRGDEWKKNWIEIAARLCRVDDGLPRRLDRTPRLKALGNAIVPQVAEEIMRSIAAFGGTRTSANSDLLARNSPYGYDS